MALILPWRDEMLLVGGLVSVFVRLNLRLRLRLSLSGELAGQAGRRAGPAGWVMRCDVMQCGRFVIVITIAIASVSGDAISKHLTSKKKSSNSR